MKRYLYGTCHKCDIQYFRHRKYCKQCDGILELSKKVTNRKKYLEGEKFKRKLKYLEKL